MVLSEFLIFIGGKVRAKRREQGISQEKLAELANLHPTYISEIERGKVNASIFTFYQLSNALKIEFADLLNLPADNVDRTLENELAEIIGRVRRMDKKTQKTFLLALKGILTGLESI
jgi:transcriptional regulator with XRE-family HTH domain